MAIYHEVIHAVGEIGLWFFLLGFVCWCLGLVSVEFGTEGTDKKEGE